MPDDIIYNQYKQNLSVNINNNLSVNINKNATIFVFLITLSTPTQECLLVRGLISGLQTRKCLTMVRCLFTESPPYQPQHLGGFFPRRLAKISLVNEFVNRLSCPGCSAGGPVNAVITGRPVRTQTPRQPNYRRTNQNPPFPASTRCTPPTI